MNVATIAEALAALTQAHPALRKHLFTEEGKLRAFVNLYLNDEGVRYLAEKEQTVVSGAIRFPSPPSIAGGSAAGLTSRSLALRSREVC